ncbi:unnamed protein product, partial [Prorocentrum cordatum]
MSCFCAGPSLARLLRRTPQYELFPSTEEDAFDMMQGPGFNDDHLSREVSMEISNDPRFFTDSVIDKRLVAFGSLVVVSTLMLENSVDMGFGMRKKMSLETVESTFQLIAFLILMGIALANVVSTYVGVAQPYHSLRLATSGPAGFEASAGYYLNRDITVYRHLAVKCALLSVPWFVLANGFRLVPKFVWDAQDGGPKEHKKSPAEGNKLLVPVPVMLHVESYFFIVLFLLAAIVVWVIHVQHMRAFQDNYDKVWHGTGMSSLLPQVPPPRSKRGRGTGLEASALIRVGLAAARVTTEGGA